MKSHLNNSYRLDLNFFFLTVELCHSDTSSHAESRSRQNFTYNFKLGAEIKRTIIVVSTLKPKLTSKGVWLLFFLLQVSVIWNPTLFRQDYIHLFNIKIKW